MGYIILTEGLYMQDLWILIVPFKISLMELNT